MVHRPRKRFGQNFLQDPWIISEIISAINPQFNQHLVEIGPGHGALTDELAQSCTLDIIELDRDLISTLENKYGANKSVHIHNSDALKFDFNRLKPSGKKLRVFGNLPYNISTRFLFHLLDYTEIIEDMHFMLQKEVADRICARPGSKRYGKLSVMMQYHCQAEMLFDVGPECFKPSPKVTSSLIRLVPFSTPPVDIINHPAFKHVVSQAFSQRRKTLRNALKNLISEQEIRSLDIDPNARAETLSLDAFARLTTQLYQKDVLVTHSCDDSQHT